MELTYTGPDPAEIGGVPLPEGWPAATHDEADEALCAEKLASGMYRASSEPETAAVVEEPEPEAEPEPDEIPAPEHE